MHEMGVSVLSFPIDQLVEKNRGFLRSSVVFPSDGD